MHDIDTADADRRKSFLEAVAAFVRALLAALFGHAMTFVCAIADGMFPELAKSRYEAADDGERAAAAEAVGPMPEIVRAEEPPPAREAPSLGGLVQRHARGRLGGWARPLEGTELAMLGGADVQAWLYGLTNAECQALAEATPSAVTMHVVGMKPVDGVRTVEAGARAAAARREAHIRRLEDPGPTPASPAFA